MERYAIITEKNPREIVLLRGRGCVYKQCRFCDYHRDADPDPQKNFALNRAVLERVTGQFGNLEVINSGSVFELDDGTLALLRDLCAEKHIHTLHFECHDLYRARIPALRRQFAPVTLKMKLGLESFDYDFREGILKKGIPARDPAEIARDFDEANLLVGLSGQTRDMIETDVTLALRWFERVCINVMCENTAALQPDPAVIRMFCDEIYPRWRDNDRVDILLQNTDFGVGD